MDGGNYIKEGQDSAKSTCLIFSPKEEAVGALAQSLKLFEVRFYQTYNF
jgi:phenylalanine-4-hydroxylase